MKLAFCLLACVAAFVCTGNEQIANTFQYFNTGSATGCEHANHYLYDYKGSDCIWYSPILDIKHPHGYDKLYVTFHMAELGNLDENDYLSIELKVGKYWYRTMKIADDVDGWRWTSVVGGHYDTYLSLCQKACEWRYHWKDGWQQFCYDKCTKPNKNWHNTPVEIDQDVKKTQIKVTLKTNKDTEERHILDNLSVYGHCRAPTKCALTKCVRRDGMTEVIATKGSKEKWDCEYSNGACNCYCDAYHTEKCTITHGGVVNSHC